MELLVEAGSKNISFNSDGLILALEGFSCESVCYFSLDEIEEIISKNKNVFVKVNRNFFNEDIDGLRDVLIKLDLLNVSGIFFYDFAVLQLVRELGLKVPLIWNQTHMVNNYKTCNYYYDKGVKYALLGKEITLEEIKEIISLSKISCMVEVVSRPSVAYSRRKLVSNYYSDLGEKTQSFIEVQEKVTGEYYDVLEDDYGTCFFLKTVTNGTSILKELYDINCPYVIFREYGIDCFSELVSDTMKYIAGGCSDSCYIDKYKKLGDSTNFFFRKTIYKVK